MPRTAQEGIRSTSEPKARRILVVDDSDSIRTMVMTHLTQLGYSVRGAADGFRGLEELRREPPDVVLSDMRMPNMDGLEFLRLARVLYPNLPIIMMSGAGLLGDAIGALKLGAWDYMEKSLIEPAVLEHAVGKALERSQLLEENKRHRTHLEQANRELSASLRILAEDEEAGRQLQRRMLPRSPRQFGPYEFSCELVPSAFLSGDFIDAFPIDAGHFGFYLADVSGHGVSSALVTVLLRSLVHQQLAEVSRRGDALINSPSRLLEWLNQEFCREDLGKHLTMFYGVVDLQEHSLRFANAGHFPWPVIFDGQTSSVLEQPGVPVGLMPSSLYQERRIELPPEMVLAVFSDGLTEILPHRTLTEKQSFLTDFFCRRTLTVEKVRLDLGLDGKIPLPDDVAILLIKRG